MDLYVIGSMFGRGDDADDAENHLKNWRASENRLLLNTGAAADVCGPEMPTGSDHADLFLDVTHQTDPTPLINDYQYGVALGMDIVEDALADLATCEAAYPIEMYGRCDTDFMERLDDSLTAAFADIDRDGDLDLYVGNHDKVVPSEDIGTVYSVDFPGQRDIMYINTLKEEQALGVDTSASDYVPKFVDITMGPVDVEFDTPGGTQTVTIGGAWAPFSDTLTPGLWADWNPQENPSEYDWAMPITGFILEPGVPVGTMPFTPMGAPSDGFTFDRERPCPNQPELQNTRIRRFSSTNAVFSVISIMTAGPICGFQTNHVAQIFEKNVTCFT